MSGREVFWEIANGQVYQQPFTVREGETFFFQAEDGIRDLTVTGVQTCALPISSRARARKWSTSACRTLCRWPRSRSWSRSEERRVGKECRSRRTPYH